MQQARRIDEHRSIRLDFSFTHTTLTYPLHAYERIWAQTCLADNGHFAALPSVFLGVAQKAMRHCGGSVEGAERTVVCLHVCLSRGIDPVPLFCPFTHLYSREIPFARYKQRITATGSLGPISSPSLACNPATPSTCSKYL